MQQGTKQKILFLAEGATLAHITRPLTLADTVDNLTHEVHFAAPKDKRRFITNAAIHQHTLAARTPQDFETCLKSGGELFSAELLRQYIRDELELLRTLQPTLVVGDLRPSLSVSAALLGIPYCCITSAYWSPFVVDRTIPFPCLDALVKHLPKNSVGTAIISLLCAANKLILPKILEQQSKGLNTVMKEFGLRPFPDYFSGFTHGDFVLFADSPAVVPCENLATNAQFIGPLTWAPSIQLDQETIQFMRNETPYIFVSLGSSGDGRNIHQILDVAGALGLRVIVATAGRFSIESGKVSTLPDLLVRDYLPGDVIARGALLTITNGGSPSTYQSLQEGTPVLGIPSNMDQLIFSGLAVKTGAVRAIRADLVSASRVRTELEFLIRKECRLAAHRIKQALASIDSRARFNQVLSSLQSYRHAV